MKKFLWCALVSPVLLTACGTAAQASPNQHHRKAVLAESSPRVPVPRATRSPSNPHEGSQAVFSSAISSAIHQLTLASLPILAPTGSAVQKVLQVSQTGSSGYNIGIALRDGLAVSFGGQHYASAVEAAGQMEQLVIVTPGPGSPTPLGYGITAGSFPNMPLISWTEHHWIIEVSASPGMPAAVLQAPARQIAEILHRELLPPTTFGVLNWAAGGNGQDSIDLSWQQGPDTYWVNESHDGYVSAAVSLAAAMRLMPSNP